MLVLQFPRNLYKYIQVKFRINFIPYISIFLTAFV